MQLGNCPDKTLVNKCRFFILTGNLHTQLFSY